jgi:hypothetical protein
VGAPTVAKRPDWDVACKQYPAAARRFELPLSRFPLRGKPGGRCGRERPPRATKTRGSPDKGCAQDENGRGLSSASAQKHGGRGIELELASKGNHFEKAGPGR